MDVNKRFQLSTLACAIFMFLAAGFFLYLWQKQEDLLVYHNTILIGGSIVHFLLGISLIFLSLHIAKKE